MMLQVADMAAKGKCFCRPAILAHVVTFIGDSLRQDHDGA
jgi:hypothetical protein